MIFYVFEDSADSQLSSVGAYDYTMLHSLGANETKSMNMF